ncbi:MAG: DUF3189 family protein [Halanaerobium sp.]|nr:DUF3189 family protein [Halanaerobium sp.]
MYSCFGSAHSSVLAAGIHVGMLPRDRLPQDKEILNLPHYDRTTSNEIGQIFEFGEDEMGHQVYIIGMAGGDKVIIPAIKDFMQVIGKPVDELVIIKTLPLVNLRTRIGGFLSRKLHLVFLGRPLTIWGLKKRYWHFVRLVGNVKKVVKRQEKFKNQGRIEPDVVE